MAAIFEAVTSPTGIIAATVTFLGLFVTVQTLVRPWLVDRREARKAAVKERQEKDATKARLEIGALDVGPIANSSASIDLSFFLSNGGGGKAVLISLLIVVLGSRPSASSRTTQTEPEIPRRLHRVQLRPGLAEYDVRARAIGPPPTVLAFDSLETEPFLVRMTSVEPERYELKIVATWFDASNPEEIRRTETSVVVLDFPFNVPGQVSVDAPKQ